MKYETTESAVQKEMLSHSKDGCRKRYKKATKRDQKLIVNSRSSVLPLR